MIAFILDPRSLNKIGDYNGDRVYVLRVNLATKLGSWTKDFLNKKQTSNNKILQQEKYCELNNFYLRSMYSYFYRDISVFMTENALVLFATWYAYSCLEQKDKIEWQITIIWLFYDS